VSGSTSVVDPVGSVAAVAPVAAVAVVAGGVIVIGCCRSAVTGAEVVTEILIFI